MIMIVDTLQSQLQRVYQQRTEESSSMNQSVPVRTGWPQLPEAPSIRRRSTDAMRWYPHGPRDDWKR